jgi:hypothetical protein
LSLRTDCADEDEASRNGSGKGQVHGRDDYSEEGNGLLSEKEKEAAKDRRL